VNLKHVLQYTWNYIGFFWFNAVFMQWDL